MLSSHDLRRLLEGHGQLFSEQLGIDLGSLEPAQLFKWFLASLLFGARIRESAAQRTYRAFEAHGLVSPATLAAADFGELVRIMGEGGYTRYDGITSREVKDAARKLLEEYGGDLSRLHAEATGPDDLMQRLMSFWGVGRVTASIFLRELRGLWPKAAPPIGGLALLAAEHLGITDPRAFWRDNAVPGFDFRHFEAALTRIGRDYCRRGRCAKAPLGHSPDIQQTHQQKTAISV